jgi:hypothetical protein
VRRIGTTKLPFRRINSNLFGIARREIRARKPKARQAQTNAETVHHQMLDVSATDAHQVMRLPSVRSPYVQARARRGSRRRKFIQE